MTEAAARHIYLIAGESSGDQLGASLMAALRLHTEDRVQFSGIGGPQMRGKGLRPLFPAHEIAVMGPSAILRRFLALARRLRQTVDDIIAKRPDVLVIIDSPEFTQRVAKRVRARAPQLRIVKYVAPQVWAWRPGRAKKMKTYIDHILAILPFEPACYERLQGPPTTYVGHPLIERDDFFVPDDEEAKRRAAEPPILVLCPGSRISEVTRLLRPFGETLSLLRKQGVVLQAVLPMVPHLRDTITREVAHWSVPVQLVEGEVQKWHAFRHARAALAASGTVTLELALAQVPMVVAYRVESWLVPFLKRLIKVPSIVLPNLILGTNIVPEFYQSEANAAHMAERLAPLLRLTPQRALQVSAFQSLFEKMQLPGGAKPSEMAAKIILLAGEA